MLDEEAQEDLRANKNLGVYKGALYENFVGEAFVKRGCHHVQLKTDNLKGDKKTWGDLQ